MEPKKVKVKVQKAKAALKSKMQPKDPACHDLYVKWGVKHLIVIDQCLARLFDLSNLNMLDMIRAMQKERKKLVSTNPAYAEAEGLLKEYKTELAKGVNPLDEDAALERVVR